ncbi:Smr/MutS family protein [Labrys monachus]|uniref:DNA-nicking Smr family endonuclease n=1 Tax=Labrys monachus TaxID=217067 RepID=A0ABU0FE77_9HYPH|nr:Smr/MutS family protein [Labrys monachus]MDQ0392459.1 DNA-nicking Smr family endonuclease [Labrys monachus]
MTTRRRRGLSSEDIELWTYITRDVEPLKRRRRRIAAKPAEEVPAAVPPGTPPPAEAVAKAAVPAGPAAAARPRPAAPKAPVLPPIAPIDRKERRQIVRGAREIEARIDLHGMRQAEAHGALRGFLAIAQMRGYSMVLVITGKGAADEALVAFHDERGVLRRVVPQWLRMPDMRPLVLGFEEAHQAHGGAGALYVRLRRIKRSGLS